MAVTIVGSASAASTSVAIPTHQVGDLIIVWAYRDGSTAVPSIPAASGTVPAWVTLDAAVGGNTNSAISAYFVATATTTTTGTWTSATGIAVQVVRGQNTYNPIGGHVRSTGTGANSVTVPAITLSIADGTSQVLSFMGARAVTAWSAATAGYLTQTSVATEVLINAKTSKTSDGSYSQANTSASSGWMAEQIEVIAAPSTVVVREQAAGDGRWGTGGFVPITATFPNAVKTGSLLVCFYEGASNLGAPSVADNINGAWTQAAFYSNIPSSSKTYGFFYKLNSASSSVGGLTVTVTPNANAGSAEALQIVEYSGIDSYDSALITNATQASGANPTISAAAPTQANDLVLFGYATDTTSNKTFSPSTNLTAIVLGTSDSKTGGELNGAASMAIGERMTAPSGATTYAMNIGASDDAGFVAIAFKSGVTVTKTQTGTARIATTVSKNQSATSRIAVTRTKPQSASSRIAVNRNIAQGSTARINVGAIVTKIQSATARIAVKLIKTQGGVARIAVKPSKDQGATSRIAIKSSKNQGATARVARNFLVAQGATARIIAQYLRSTSQTGTARIAANVFTPPTYRIAATYVDDRPDRVYPASKAASMLFRFFKGPEVGISVLKHADGTYEQITMPTQDQCDAAEITYLGGHKYYVDSAEAGALMAAGFDVSIES